MIEGKTRKRRRKRKGKEGDKTGEIVKIVENKNKMRNEKLNRRVIVEVKDREKVARE